MAKLFESLMVISFGISWPISVAKMLRTKSVEGKSVVFSYFILLGYVFGILSKLLSNQYSYVIVFYIINFFVVGLDILLYHKFK